MCKKTTMAKPAALTADELAIDRAFDVLAKLNCELESLHLKAQAEAARLGDVIALKGFHLERDGTWSGTRNQPDAAALVGELLDVLRIVRDSSSKHPEFVGISDNAYTRVLDAIALAETATAAALPEGGGR